MPSRTLTMDELNRTALEQFVYQPVSCDMISYLAQAAQSVIACDPSSTTRAELPHSPPKTPERDASLSPEDKTLPTVEEFITQLVVSSNVQVPTLMSSLVYLNRLRSRLQPQARGIRCTAHRIFLASLILSAKYLNDSSPKNKHWANYTKITTEYFHFGFSRAEVNTMEKQLLFLLEWDLRIEEEDLYRELDFFLDPLRVKIADRHLRKMQQREEKRRQQELHAAARRYPSPASSHTRSRSRHASPAHSRSTSGSYTPPGLSYSSSASSYASSTTSSRDNSRAATPLDSDVEAYGYTTAVTTQGSLYDSPVQIAMEPEYIKDYQRAYTGSRMLPYEISPDQYQQLHDESAKKRPMRGVFGRLFGTAAAR